MDTTTTQLALNSAHPAGIVVSPVLQPMFTALLVMEPPVSEVSTPQTTPAIACQATMTMVLASAPNVILLV